MTDSARQDAAEGDAPEAEAGQGTPTDPGTPVDPATSADQGTTADQAAGEDQEKPDIDEVKRKFRAALDRKRETHADDGSAAGGRDAGRIHGSRGPAAGRRTFRRKSG
jgi:hypothetical protein